MNTKKLIRNVKTFMLLYGLATILGITINMLWIFLTAYSYPSKMTKLYINAYGEANVELISLFIALPIMCYLCYLMFLQIEKKRSDI